MESCGMQVVKYLLFGFNLVFAISGLAIIVAGGVVLGRIDDYRTFMESRIVGPPIVLIIAGLIIFVIAFLGCFGAIRENSNMLIAYAVLLLIIFIIEFAVGITAAVAKEDFQDAMKDSMEDSMKNYKDDKVQRTVWDKLQQKLECCGVNRPADWQKAKLGVQVPSSCCEMMSSPTCDNTTLNDMYKEGCYSKLQETVQDGALALAGVGIGIAFLELAGITLALLMVYTIRKSDEK